MEIWVSWGNQTKTQIIVFSPNGCYGKELTGICHCHKGTAPALSGGKVKEDFSKKSSPHI